MAENKSQAQHLASLDFDISGIIETLKQVDEQTKAYGLQVGKNFSQSVQSGLNEGNKSYASQIPQFIDEKQLSSAKEKLDEISASYSKLSKTVMTYDADNNLLRGSITYDDAAGKKVVEQYRMIEGEWKRLTSTQTNDTAKQEKQVQQVVAQIEKMIEKQKQFNTTVSNQRSSSVNKDILTQSNQYISGLEQLKSEIAETGKVSEQQKSQIANYGSRIKELSGYYQEAGTKGESFLQKISDKAKWLGAFYVVNELRQGFIETINIIRETEDAVVDLQRVLNDDKISQSKMSDELYNVAYEYGRTFEEVAEVSTQFAQAGYDWADTMELTRGTMLALNTAELDVTQSTQGLIAILAQWNLEAEDYADVIDKINITADNFAVTSEKIVAALQRSSSSARNANISLEQTIGIITALAEATGRSGENIGTALNSLIIYTSKASALETFAKNGSDAMKQVVSEYQKGAASIYDVWVQLSKELGNLTAAQQNALFQSEDYQEFADTLESQAEEFTSQIKEVYGAVGTYRQNYFIALLNDMGKAQEAIENMSDAEGYSLSENEKYMQTLTANINQLKASLSELAVQLGEAGLMDILKFLTDAGVGIAKLTKSLGGIVPVMTTIGGIIATIKAQKIGSWLDNIVLSVKGNWKNISSFFSMIKEAPGIMGKFNAATTLLSGSLSSLAGVFGIVTTAAGVLISAYNGIKSAIEENRRQRIEEAEAYLQQSDGIEKLVVEYNILSQVSERTASQEEQFKNINDQIIDLLGERTEALKGLTAGTEEYNEALNNLTKDQIEANRVEYANLREDYASELKSAASGNFGNDARVSIGREDAHVRNIIQSALQEFGESPYYPELNLTFEPLSKSAEDIQKFYEALAIAKEELVEFGSQSEENADILADSKAYDEIIRVMGNLGSSFENYIKYSTLAIANNKIANEELPKTTEELEKFKEEVFDASGANEVLRDTIYEIVEDFLPSLKESALDAGEALSTAFSVSEEELNSFKESIEELNDSIDGFQSGFDTVVGAIEEFNTNGYLSIDTIQALISAGGEYLSMLEFTSDGIRLNEDAVRRLIDAQTANIDALLSSAYASDVLRISEKYLGDAFSVAGDEASKATSQISGLNPQISQLIQNAWEGGDAAIHLAEGLAAISGSSIEGVDMKAYQEELDAARNNWINLGNEIRNSFNNQSAWSNKVSSSAQNAAREQTNAIRKQLEAQKEAVRDRYDAEINALKDVQEENDRLARQEEYYRNRREALKEISRAESRSGVEYREQEDEARQKLADLDREWEETVADWSIEDKIAELESLRDAEISALDAQIDALESSVSSVGSSMVSTYSNANKTMLSNYEKEYLEPIESGTKEAYSNVFEEMQNRFSETLDYIVEQSKVNSAQLENIYAVNFLNPFSESLSKIQQQLFSIRVSTPMLPYRPYSNGTGLFGNDNVVNNITTSTRNTNIFASVNNSSAANSLLRGIWNKP